MILTDAQILARDVDTAVAALPPALWPLLVPAAQLALVDEWAGTGRNGAPACLDCGRAQAYGNHPCSCPWGRLRRKLGVLLEAASAREVPADA
jgi:hypothetical protein